MIGVTGDTIDRSEGPTYVIVVTGVLRIIIMNVISDRCDGLCK